MVSLIQLCAGRCFKSACPVLNHADGLKLKHEYVVLVPMIIYLSYPTCIFSFLLPVPKQFRLYFCLFKPYNTWKNVLKQKLFLQKTSKPAWVLYPRRPGLWFRVPGEYWGGGGSWTPAHTQGLTFAKEPHMQIFSFCSQWQYCVEFKACNIRFSNSTNNSWNS